MSQYIKLSTLEYPRHEGDIRNEHPDIREDQTWPNFPCPDTYALVEDAAPMPELTAMQYAIELAPAQVDGRWVRVWEIREWTEAEAIARNTAHTTNMHAILYQQSLDNPS